MKKFTIDDVLKQSWGGPEYASYEGRLGGGQANSGQAATAAAQQTAASNQDMALSKQYGGQEQQIFNTLFGNGGKGGTLSQFLNPASLNQPGLNSNYQTQFNEASNQIAQNYKNQRGSLAQGWANAGMGTNNTPSGFQADQMRQLRSSEADTRGQTYAGLKGQQYSDALNNFWNANNIASGQQGSATSGSTTGAGNSGSSSAALYGTAGQYHAGQIIPAISQVGSAAVSRGKSGAPGCWIAEAIYGVDDPRTLLLRAWLNSAFIIEPMGRIIMAVYLAIGRQVAWFVRRSEVLKAFLRPLFEKALVRAREWESL